VTNWRDVLKIHPAAHLFPLMGPDELRALAEDIKRNRLRSPIVFLYPGEGGDGYTVDGYLELSRVVLLDGRNRLDAMEIAGIELVGSAYIDGRDSDELVFPVGLADEDIKVFSGLVPDP
jgi:hypothetical protein